MDFSFLAKLVVVTWSFVMHFNIAEGHGFMIEPPGRASLWRYGYRVPTNYDDNQLFCGGYAVHYVDNNGKCGPCGDPWQGPRANEAGGKYARGIIARKYNTGQVIDVYINITVNHWGWIEFRLCPNNNINVPITHDCLNQYPLRIVNNGYRYELPSKEVRVWFLQVELPANLECSQCVLQWKYHGGNRWGTDPDGWKCTGCGLQEEFYACADIAIGDEYSAVHAQLPQLKMEREYTSSTTTHSPRPAVKKLKPRIIFIVSQAHQWQSHFLIIMFSITFVLWHVL